MGNPLTNRVKIGTIGELLVQTRLLQYGVQAAPPIKDSGNDLIAARGEVFRGIQVKTTTGRRPNFASLPAHFHILAIVYLHGTDDAFLLDQSPVYLVPRSAIDGSRRVPACLERFVISSNHVDALFKNACIGEQGGVP